MTIAGIDKKAKVYEIVDRKLEGRKISEDGSIETLKTIYKEYEDKFFKKYLS